VVSLAGGGFAVFFDGGCGCFDQVFYRIFDADGNPLTDQLSIDPLNIGQDDALLQAFALADGSMAVLYIPHEETSNGDLDAEFMQHIASDGTLIGPAVLFGATPSDPGNPIEESFLTEFRAAHSSADALFTGVIEADSTTPPTDFTSDLVLKLLQP